jgi:sRNA-binding regulator protein Hfq
VPPQTTAAQADDLVAHARACFGDLSAAETKLFETAPKGEFVVCGPNNNWNDPANYPANVGEWGADREIRAELIRWLCVDHTARERVDPKGIQAYGARVVGKLDLSYITIPFGLALRRCRLMEDTELYSADLVQLDLQGSWVLSFNADHINVKSGVFLRNGFRAEGEVRLAGAQLGHLDCDNSVFTNPSKVALHADGINVKGDVFLRNGFRAEGEVRLPGAKIEGDLGCEGGVFANASKVALRADGISVNGSIFFWKGFRAEGEVRLLGAHIGSVLGCENGVFANPSKDALSADRLSAKGGVFLNDGFRAEGEVRLVWAEIEGGFDCQKSVFTNPSKVALNADGISVKGDVFLRNGFRAEGEVRLPGAKIEGDLDCASGTINGELIAQGLSVSGVLFWREMANLEQTRVNLRNASVGALSDVVENWPPAGRLVLDGFTYARISGGQKDARTRLEWLGRQESFVPQPYRQLAKVLREEGDDTGARRVLFDMERLRRQEEDRGRLARLWSGILQLTIGFGYYPGRSLLWLLWLTVLSTGLTWGGYAVGSIAPSDKEAYGTFKQSSQLPPHYERFHASVYALENSFPLVKLGQAERWQPDPNSQWQCSSPKRFARRLCWALSPALLRQFRWGQICLGWFFTTMFVAGVTGIVHKD